MFFPHLGIGPLRLQCWYVPHTSVIRSVHGMNRPSKSLQYSKQQYVFVSDLPHGGSVPLRPPCVESLQPQKDPCAESRSSPHWRSHICGRETSVLLSVV